MKKIILTIAAVCAFGAANAQDIKYGVKGGLNSFTLSGATGASGLVSFHVGGLLEYKVSDKFAVQPEVLYSMQGAKFTDGKIETSYINIPLMAKYFVTEAISIQAGPQIGFLMSAKADGTDVKDALNSTDFGLNIGGGYNIGENMMIDLRYNLGFSTVNKDTSFESWKNAGLQISFGYKF